MTDSAQAPSGPGGEGASPSQHPATESGRNLSCVIAWKSTLKRNGLWFDLPTPVGYVAKGRKIHTPPTVGLRPGPAVSKFRTGGVGDCRLAILVRTAHRQSAAALWPEVPPIPIETDMPAAGPPVSHQSHATAGRRFHRIKASFISISSGQPCIIGQRPETAKQIAPPWSRWAANLHRASGERNKRSSGTTFRIWSAPWGWTVRFWIARSMCTQIYANRNTGQKQTKTEQNANCKSGQG